MPYTRYSQLKQIIKQLQYGAWRGQVTVNRVCVKVLQVTDDTLAAYRYKFDVNT